MSKTSSWDSGTLSEDGVLYINKDAAVAYLKDCDEHITDLDIVIARPGDDTRIVPVIETIEPRCRMDGRCLFPGVTDDVVPAGDGELKALKGCCVTVVAKNWGSFGDGVIDMGSEGAKHTYWSKLVNICLVGDTDEEFERHEQQKCNHALRWAGHRLAEYLGKIVKDLPAEDTEEYVFDPIGRLHNFFYSTVGTGTTEAEARRMAQEMIPYFKKDKVDAIIMGST